MKKMCILLLVLFLGGCQFYLKEENTAQYQNLKLLYNNFLEKDVYNDNNFYDFINKGTLYNISSTIKIENDEEISSGVIIKKEKNTYYALTIINNTENILKIFDYINVEHHGCVDYIALDTGITIIKFFSLSNYYVVDLCRRELFKNEVVLTTGYLNLALNNLKLGLIHDLDGKEITVSYLKTYYNAGAPVFDNELKLIGLQKTLINDEIVVIRLNNTILEGGNNE